MSKYSVIAISALAWFAIPTKSQTIPETHPFIQRMAVERETAANAGADEPHARMQRELIARAVVERQAKLRLDTEKLLALAAELKQHVDTAGPNILSLDVIKKAQEIEKLAKSVREKMRDAY